jgi:hypothetical protein
MTAVKLPQDTWGLFSCKKITNMLVAEHEGTAELSKIFC